MTESKSLKSAYQDDFTIGAAVSTDVIKTHRRLLVDHFNSITAENQMKFESIQPEEGRFTFEGADELVSFAHANGMKVRGHTLVWHNQTPGWVFQEKGSDAPASRSLLQSRMKHHIDTVLGRYNGRVYAWDVVNEAIDDSSDNWLRQSKWLTIMGEDYLEQAFRYAHAADENALLFYNDYNETNPVKRDKIVRLLDGLKREGVPIHGMGMQAHWNIYGPSIDEIAAAIEAYASLGLQIQFTEMDISVFDFQDRRTDLTAPTKDMLDALADRYEALFSLFHRYKSAVSGVTLWGVADDHTWLDHFPVRGRKNWPLLFNESHEPKEAFHRIVSIPAAGKES